ncbi:hypothetical protein [Mycobacterium marseillense]|uniref:hypothetical protein n=1 Tax=Mycobacterium marseillense TaxID=701042 RepID=UPI0011A99157|nr:hypothetical protein [Mycobacterium marseillense]
MADVRTVCDVEILKVGTWDGSSGTFKVTREDLESAVEFARAGVLRPAPLKIGHDDPRFDGGPALGHLDNLRIVGDTLLADFVNVPVGLAKLLVHAYRDRSIEGVFDYRDGTGRTWRFIVTACALLGERAPAVHTLKQLGELYGVDVAASGRRVIVAAAALHPEDAQRRRAVQVAAARRRRTNRLNPIGV